MDAAHPDAANRDGTVSERGDPGRRLSERTTQALGWAGIALHYDLSLLVAPPWAAYVLWGLLALLLLLAVHLLRRRSPWAVAVPFAAYGVWPTALTFGERAWG